MPRVSVGLPVYNGENYLESSLVSLLKQTYEDFELIISDNASTDRTSEICRDYAVKDARIRYFLQDQNGGCARNSNFTFLMSKGEYFKWASHDDLHAPSFIERCVEVLDREEDVILACPRVTLIDGEGREIDIRHDRGGHYWLDSRGQRSMIRPYDPPRRLDSPKPWLRFRELLLETNWDIEIYGLVRAEALRRTGLHGIYHGTDKRILAELTLIGKFFEIPEVLFYYRQHPVQAKLYSASSTIRNRYLGGGHGIAGVIPRLHNLKGYLHAVDRAEISNGDRLLAYGAVASWLFRLNRWPALLAEAYHSVLDSWSAGRARSATGVS